MLQLISDFLFPRRTTSDFLLEVTLSWNGMLPAAPGAAVEKDSGMVVEELRTKGKGRVPTAAWQGSFAFSANFRQELLGYIAEIVPDGVFSQKSQVFLETISIQDPLALGEGQWLVNVVANWIFLDQAHNQKVIPFNKKVFVRAVEAPEFKSLPPGSVADVVAVVRKAGLEVYQMEELILQ